jgi:DNA processing protein
MSRDSRLQLAVAGLHPDRTRALVADYGSAGAVVHAVRRGRIEVSARARAAVARSAADIRRTLAGLGVGAVWLGDASYPPALASLPDAPDVLFVRGVLSEDPAVAVVGTRRCTAYGRSIARSFGYAVARAGWVVVSGLARGVDGEAHRGLLAAGGSGIAVLGSGSNVVYPGENRGLHDALISAGGAVVTEYPPGTPPEAWRFPPRNRIIAGLSKAVVVVEAAVKGGALITAAAAADQGTTVLAVPGDVDRVASEGCNLLIRDGAVPVLGPGDLVEALSLILGPPVAPAAPVHGEDGAVLDAVGPAGAPVEALVERSGLPPEGVLAAVARLEAAGRVLRRGGLIVRTG